MSHRPILVTGSHRSGTTWVGRMLCRSREAGYIHEPFNPARFPGWSGGRIPYWFLYVTEENEPYYEHLVEDILDFRYPLRWNLGGLRGPKQLARFATDLASGTRERLRHRRPLVKDPIALFSAPWLHRRFDAVVVVMIRHPAAFAGSIKRLDWRFRFRGWLAQERLLRDRLGAYEEEMRRLSAGEPDIVDQAILQWNAMHSVIHSYRAEHPGWMFVRHEDLAADPSEGFRRIYDHAGLRWDEKVVQEVLAHSNKEVAAELPRWRHGSVKRNSSAATITWQTRLTSEEKERIRDGTAEVAGLFYSPEELDA